MKEHTVKMVDSFEGHDDEMVFESFEATAENPVPSEIYVMPQKIHGMGVCICKEGESMISMRLMLPSTKAMGSDFAYICERRLARR